MSTVNISSLLTAFRHADSTDEKRQLIETLMEYDNTLLQKHGRTIQRTIGSVMFGEDSELILKAAALHKAADRPIKEADGIPTLIDYFDQGDDPHKLAALQALKVFSPSALHQYDEDVVDVAERAFEVNDATIQEEAAKLGERLDYQVVRIGGRPVSVGL